MAERPFITANWRHLLLLNFEVPADALSPLVPPGTEIDLYEGRAYVSIVGFRFDAARLFGLPIPGHTRFPEINLRYYVRRVVGDEVRRGVVFVREIAPRRGVALTANWLYNESYIVRRMRSGISVAGSQLSTGDTIEYAWRSSTSVAPVKEKVNSTAAPRKRIPRLRLRMTRWNRLAARVAAPLALPAADSLEAYFVEHYWGYVVARDGTTREYRVAHDPWLTAPVDSIDWDCDILATYSPPLAKFLAQPPVHALVAAGSTIKLYRGRRVS